MYEYVTLFVLMLLKGVSKMSLKYCYVYSEGEIRPFENWMNFAVALAQYVKEHRSVLKVYLSLPERDLFTPFFIFGCVDYDIRNEQYIFNKQRISFLEQGDIVCYKENGTWKKMRFINFRESDGEKIIELRNAYDRTSIEVRERSWDMRLCIPNKQRRTTNTTVLENVYGEEKIKNAVELCSPLTYVSTVKTKWQDMIHSISFYLNGITINGSDMFRNGVEEYSTVAFLNVRNVTNISNIFQNVIVCNGTLKTLHHMTDKAYKQQKQVYIIDRMENEERIELVQNNFKTAILEEHLTSKNGEFIAYINALNVHVPRGVELHIAAYEG